MNPTQNKPEQQPEQPQGTIIAERFTKQDYEKARMRALASPVSASDWNPDLADSFSMAKHFNSLYAVVTIVLCIRTENFYGWRIESMMVSKMSAKPVRLGLLSTKAKNELISEVEAVLSHDKFYRANWRKRNMAASKVIEVGLSEDDAKILADNLCI